MIYSQFFIILPIMFNLFQIKIFGKFDKLTIENLPWDIISCIAIISLINEFKKYIITYDLLSFLGLSYTFTLRFKKILNFMTLIIKFFCILTLILNLIKVIIFIISQHIL